MKLFSRAMLAGVMLAASTMVAAAADKTEISLSRFFGACDADYGTVTDVSKANGECGIITALINKFNADSKTTVVKPEIVEWPGYDQLTARIKSGEPPVISVMHASVISDYSSRGLLEPLDDGFKKVGIDPASFTDSGRNAVTKDGKIYALPFDTHSWLWHINMNLFKKAGLVDADGKPVLPKSPDELLAQAKQFKEKTGKPYFVMFTVKETAAFTRDMDTLLDQQDSNWMADPTKVDLSGPEAKNALTLLKTLYDNGDITKDQDYAAGNAGFIKGDGGVMVNGTWVIDSLDQESKKPDGALANGYEVRPFPQLYKNPKLWADSHSWVILKQDLTDAQRASAYEFLKFLYDNNFQWARTGHLSVSKAVVDSAEFKALPHRADIASVATNGTPLPSAVKRQFGIQDIEGEEVANGMMGAKTVDQALADAQSRINELLANAK